MFRIYPLIEYNQLKMTSIMTTVLDQETEEAQEREFLWNVQRRIRIQGEQFLPILRFFQHFFTFAKWIISEPLSPCADSLVPRFRNLAI